ncbi:MAG: magnesium transporter CorA family protein [Burkholderiaceae bacterium]|nr:magnesium transporter CorA family protein [Burkholderiaceae bacterium]
MRVFHLGAERLAELDALPAQLPATGFLWVGCARREFETQLDALQSALLRWTGGQLLELHVSDLANDQLPSNFDSTSWYDLLVFRRLAAGTGSAAPAGAVEAVGTAGHTLVAIDTNPVGFAIFDRVLLTVHPTDCQVQDFFATRLAQIAPTIEAADTRRAERPGETRAGALRMPASPADLMLRMVNHMVDGYLELRRTLTRELGRLQQELLEASNFRNWRPLLDSRIALHLLEDTCEDQQSAIQEWIDALDEWPATDDKALRRERELLRVRARDVLEHIARVLGHVRRLESSAETAVQMHFSAQGNRTNEIMRTLTVLTAIFLPLNLVTGIFGMNFDGLPLIHSTTGFWLVSGAMLALGIGLSAYFWRKRYLRRNG